MSKIMNLFKPKKNVVEEEKFEGRKRIMVDIQRDKIAESALESINEMERELGDVLVSPDIKEQLKTDTIMDIGYTLSFVRDRYDFIRKSETKELVECFQKEIEKDLLVSLKEIDGCDMELHEKVEKFILDGRLDMSQLNTITQYLFVKEHLKRYMQSD